MKQLKSQEFQAEVLESKVPVLVDFSATWCGPCQMMGPVLEQLSAEYEGKAKIVKVDIDESMDLAQKYRIMSVPNMIIFKDGAPVDAVIGAVPANHLKEKLMLFCKTTKRPPILRNRGIFYCGVWHLDCLFCQ